MGLRARIEQAVQDRRLARGERALERRREFLGALDPLAMAAEGLGIGAKSGF
jgi:hypothetical protein